MKQLLNKYFRTQPANVEQRDRATRNKLRRRQP